MDGQKDEPLGNVLLVSTENMQIGIAICLRSTYWHNIILLERWQSDGSGQFDVMEKIGSDQGRINLYVVFF
jgi:hypothetical protein